MKPSPISIGATAYSFLGAQRYTQCRAVPAALFPFLLGSKVSFRVASTREKQSKNPQPLLAMVFGARPEGTCCVKSDTF